MKKKLHLVFLFLLFSFVMKSQEMVYTPISPAFGGNTFNYQWMLSSAEAQNTFEEESTALDKDSELDSFKKSLNRQLLNQITNSLFKDQFGDGDLEPGTYVFGSLVLEITPTADGLLINILDTQTGDTTQITIPN